MLASGIDYRGKIIPDGVLHRAHVEGDKAGSESAWYLLHADEHANGKYGCWKRYGKNAFTWSSGESKEWTPEQRREWHEKMERQRLEREAADRARHEAAAERAEQLWNEADDDEQSVGNHPYLKRKKVKSHGLKVGKWEVTNAQGETIVVSTLALLVPIRDTRKKIWSLQAILPNNKKLGRDKDYLKDGAKHGYFFTIGKPTTNVILVCEGYATGASLHEATGYAVVVAFDSSNLEAVADILRNRFPDYKIVLCGDNDQWTLQPIENPGKHYAEAAATKMGGLVAIPQFQNLETKPTDFNDLATLEGLETVRRIIEEVLARPAESDDEPPPDPPASSSPAPAAPLEGEVIPRDKGTESPPPPEDDDDERALPSGNNPFFEVLGYDHELYYIFNKIKSQLMVYDRSQFTESAFAELAPTGVFWQRHFKGGKKGSFDKIAAFEFVIHCAHERGIYDPDRARGRGAWFDNGRIVYHHGSYLTVDSKTTNVSDLKTNYIYEMQRALPDLQAVEPLTRAEGDELVFLAGDFRWTRPVSGALLCGWMMLAPICGALRWRPHVWITGGAGSGKSTILNEFVNPLLFHHNLFAQGNTTEAGLRQKLRTDALPIIFEESEQNEEKDRLRIQHVLSLIRQSSTESIARVYKGTVAGQSMEFLIRSMFCLASIQVGMKQQADLERVTTLALKSKKDDSPDAGPEWEALRDRLHAMVTQKPMIGARFVKRSMTMIPIIRENIHVFSTAANKFFGSAREGDQYGALLAGYWSMYRDDAATLDEARSVINSYTWEEHRDVSDSDEGQAALSALMGSRLRASKNLEFTIFELLSAACGTPVQGVEIDRIEANALLRRYGMIVKDGRVLLSNLSVELQKIMDRTNFGADWKGVLVRVAGADRNDNKTATFNGVSSKCIRLPIPEPDTGVQKSWLTAENPVERG